MSLSVSIATYRVGTTRHAEQGGQVRWLSLEAAPGQASPYKTFVMYFYETEQRQLGVQNPAKGQVIAALPVRDYTDYYHILQTEKPTFISWEADPASNQLTWVGLATNAEPVGEGYVDNSNSSS